MKRTLSVVATVAAVTLGSLAVMSAAAQTPPPSPPGQPERPGRPDGPPRGRQGRPPNVDLPSIDGFEQGMNRAGRGLRALKASAFDASSRDGDLGAIQAIEAGLVMAKSNAAALPMSQNAQAKFGTDQAAYQLALRKSLVDGLRQALAVDSAILDGDGTKARNEFARLGELMESSHALYQGEETPERRAPDRGTPPPPPPARP